VRIRVEQGRMKALLMYSMLTCVNFLGILISNELYIYFLKFIPVKLLSQKEYCILGLENTCCSLTATSDMPKDEN
jgi:hypothetical protein